MTTKNAPMPEEERVRCKHLVLELHAQGVRPKDAVLRIASEFNRPFHASQYYQILKDAGVSVGRKSIGKVAHGGKVLLPKTEDDIIGALSLRKVEYAAKCSGDLDLY